MQLSQQVALVTGKPGHLAGASAPHILGRRRCQISSPSTWTRKVRGDGGGRYTRLGRALAHRRPTWVACRTSTWRGGRGDCRAAAEIGILVNNA